VDEGRFSIPADDLYQRLGSAAASSVTDARRAPAFEGRRADGRRRCDPL